MSQRNNATVREINLHPAFEGTTLKDDLAVLLLEINKDTPTDQRYPICLMAELSSSEETANSTIGIVERGSEEKFVKMELQNGIVCLEQNRDQFGKYLSTKNICTLNSQKKNSTGLPGDGLFEKVHNGIGYVWKLKGVASFTKNAPYFLFTDVSKYYAFVGNSFVK